MPQESKQSDLNAKLVSENKKLYSANAVEFAKINDSLEQVKVEDSLVKDQLSVLKKVTKDVQTGTIKDKKEALQQTKNTIAVLEKIADQTDEQKKVLSKAKETEKSLKKSTSLLNRFKETAADYAVDSVGAMLGAATDSPLVAMGAQFIGNKLREKREQKKQQIAYLREQAEKKSRGSTGGEDQEDTFEPEIDQEKPDFFSVAETDPDQISEMADFFAGGFGGTGKQEESNIEEILEVISDDIKKLVVLQEKIYAINDRQADTAEENRREANNKAKKGILSGKGKDGKEKIIQEEDSVMDEIVGGLVGAGAGALFGGTAAAGGIAAAAAAAAPAVVATVTAGVAVGTGLLINKFAEDIVFEGENTIGGKIFEVFNDVEPDEKELEKQIELQIDDIDRAGAPGAASILEREGVLDIDWIGQSEIEDWDKLKEYDIGVLKGLYAWGDLGAIDQRELEKIIIQKQEDLKVQAIKRREEGKKQKKAQVEKLGDAGGELGSISAKYESGGRGAGTVSTGAGDAGGASYGTHQLASKTGTLQKFLDSSGYGAEFSGMTPGTPEFNAKWKEIAANDPNFGKAQHNFIQQTHYNPQMQKLQEGGMDLSNRGKSVQEAVFSTSVQYGGNTSLIQKALADMDIDNMTDEQIVTAIQDYKAANVNQHFRSSSDNVRQGVAKRIQREKADLVALANSEENYSDINQSIANSDLTQEQVAKVDSVNSAIDNIDTTESEISNISVNNEISKEESRRSAHEAQRKASTNVNVQNNSATNIGRSNDNQNTSDEDIVFNRIGNAHYAY